LTVLDLAVSPRRRRKLFVRKLIARRVMNVF